MLVPLALVLFKRVRPSELEKAYLAVVGFVLVLELDMPRDVAPLHDLATFSARVGSSLVGRLDIPL